jgi:rare lipoprotein A
MQVKDPDRLLIQQPAFLNWLLLLIFFSAIAGCSVPASPRPAREPSPPPYKVAGKWYQPQSHAHGFQQKGIASWYGKKFHGRKTSNGEVYNMYGISAAHKTLPFNTVVRVHNLDNGKRIDVRINDRGPFVRGRIIDLSYGAAQELGLVGPGTARVKIVALGAVDGPGALDKENRPYVPVEYQRGVFTFQVGAFRDKNNAEKLRARLDENYQNAHITTYESPDGVFYRVRVGRFTTLQQARKGEEILIREGFDPMIVAE